MTCFDCTAPAAWTNRSEERFCTRHAIAWNIRHADGLTRTVAANPQWDADMVAGLTRTVVEARATAERLAARG